MKPAALSPGLFSRAWFSRAGFWRALAAAADLSPLSPRGVAALLLCTGALWLFGYGRMDLVVFALAITGLSVLLFCLFGVIVGGLIIQRRIQRHIRRHGPENSRPDRRLQLEAGFPNETGFHLPAMDAFPLLRLDWRVLRPDCSRTRLRQRGRLLSEELIPQRRCLSGFMLRRFTVSDVLGFCRFVWYSQDEQACMVLPRCNTLSRLPLPRSLSAEDGVPNQSGSPQGDRMEIRPYTPGDSVRDILWKAYARNRQLNVRLAEKSLSHNTRTLAYLLSGPDDEAAAAAARLALESGALGEDWLFGTDGTAEPCPTLAGALQAVAASRPLDGAHPYGLDGFLKAAGALQATGASQTAGAAMPHCLIFAAASGGPWLAHLKRTIASGRGRFSLILATDGFRQTRQESLYRRWGRRMLLRPDVAQEMSQEVEQETQLKTSMESMDRAPSRETLLALLRSLIVESVLVIDRRNGLCFNGNLRPI